MRTMSVCHLSDVPPDVSVWDRIRSGPLVEEKLTLQALIRKHSPP